MAEYNSKYFSLPLFIIISLYNFIEVHAICKPDIMSGQTNVTAEAAGLKRISSLQEEVWEFHSFVIGACTNELLKHKAAGALQKTDKGEVVLGRTNRTHSLYGERWAIVEYYSGDISQEKSCTFVTVILFICDPHETHHGSARFLEQEECKMRFEVATSALCPSEVPSVGSLIFVWVVFLIALYCFGGIVYKRFKLRVQGRQQMPHFQFWKRIGNGCADCTNWACRCDDEPINAWDAETDRDDVLLRP